MDDEKNPIRRLPVELSEMELETYKEALPAILERYDSTETAKKNITRELSDRLREDRAEYTRIRRAITDRSEYRDVQCHWVVRISQRKLELVREDTGQVVEQRPMTREEYVSYRQGRFDFDGIDADREKEGGNA